MIKSTHTIWTWLSEPRSGWILAAFIAGGLIAGFLLIALMCQIKPKYRKLFVAIVTFIAGLFFSIEFLIPRENRLTSWKPFVAESAMIVGSFTILLGISNLFQIHGKAIRKRTQGWVNSLAFFISFFAILLTGFLKDYYQAYVVKKTSETIFGILFSGFLVPLNATTFSLIAFYIVSAAYRAFRIRSTEAGFMMGAAIIIMLALVPIGSVLTGFLPETGFLSVFRLEKLGPWILANPNMAVQRAIAFGIAIGSLAMGLRIWLSLERGSFFDRQL